PEITVRRFLLSSNVDAEFVETLRHDLESLANKSSPLDGHAELTELELQSVVSRLAELGRRRQTNLNTYRAYIANQRGQGGAAARSPSAARDVASADPMRALLRGDCSVKSLAALNAHYAVEGLPDLANRGLTGKRLSALAKALGNLQLECDVTTDNDPRQHRA